MTSELFISFTTNESEAWWKPSARSHCGCWRWLSWTTQWSQSCFPQVLRWTVSQVQDSTLQSGLSVRDIRITAFAISFTADEYREFRVELGVITQHPMRRRCEHPSAWYVLVAAILKHFYETDKYVGLRTSWFMSPPLSVHCVHLKVRETSVLGKLQVSRLMDWDGEHDWFARLLCDWDRRQEVHRVAYGLVDLPLVTQRNVMAV